MVFFENELNFFLGEKKMSNNIFEPNLLWIWRANSGGNVNQLACQASITQAVIASTQRSGRKEVQPLDLPKNLIDKKTKILTYTQNYSSPSSMMTKKNVWSKMSSSNTKRMNCLSS
jgi:hypothetical protein